MRERTAARGSGPPAIRRRLDTAASLGEAVRTVLGLPAHAAGVAATSPIIVVGTHRSGTTMLGRALGAHPDVAYVEEPRHVWSWGHNYRGHDVLAAPDATPRIKRHIRATFDRMLQQSGACELAEKTPSNCLRLPFIFEVFPNARFVHVQRDARAVVRSTHEMLRTQGPNPEWFLPRLIGTPLWEWPAFAPRAYRTLMRRQLGGKMQYWGPRPPGWEGWVRRDSIDVMLAKQWRATAGAALDFRDEHPAASWVEIRYENFVEQPGPEYERVLSSLGLGTSRSATDTVVESTERRARQKLGSGSLDSVRPILEPTMNRLGYDW